MNFAWEEVVADTPKAPETTITYNLEVELTIPAEGCSPFIKIEMTPKDAGCFIYGYGADGAFINVEVRGSQERLELPFAKSKIFVRYLHGLESMQVWTLGWRDLRRSR